MPAKNHIDPIGCVGMLILVVILGATAFSVLRGNDTANAVGQVPTIAITAVPVEPTATLAALPSITPSPAPTFTPIPSTTNTPAPSQTPTASATATNTATVTKTAIPPNTPIPTNYYTPTFTPTPLLPTPNSPDGRDVRVPILMYHYISDPPPGSDIYRVDLSVSPEVFEQQVRYLTENGFTTISFYDMSLAIAGKIDLPPKPVIISIDDGYLDNYTNAFPILQRYGQTATIFLATDFVKRGDYNYMTWEMVAEMINAGISVEPHSRTHADLRNQSREALIYEIQGPQRDLEPHLGYTPRFFAYPSGQYDQYTIEILEESGYWGAVTTQGGWWHGYEDRYEWTRLRVRNNTPLGDFIFFINRYLE